MEITINLPKRVFANLSAAAKQSHRRVDEVIVESLEQEFVKEAEKLEKLISVCSDKEVRELALIQMPATEDQRLSQLLQKQGSTELTAKEQQEMWELMDLNRITTLKKAIALSEISQRGLHEQT